MSRVVVIGAGFGGIAAALRARAKGHDVTLVDRCARLGGRAQVFEKDGFRHDAWPTVLTAPFLFEELFALFGKDIADYVRIVPLPLWYRFHFHDGETFDYGGGIEQTLAEITRIHPPDAQGYLALLEQSRRIYDVGFTALADAPFHRFLFMLRHDPGGRRVALPVARRRGLLDRPALQPVGVVPVPQPRRGSPQPVSGWCRQPSGPGCRVSCRRPRSWIDCFPRRPRSALGSRRRPCQHDCRGCGPRRSARRARRRPCRAAPPWADLLLRQPPAWIQACRARGHALCLLPPRGRPGRRCRRYTCRTGGTGGGRQRAAGGPRQRPLDRVDAVPAGQHRPGGGTGPGSSPNITLLPGTTAGEVDALGDDVTVGTSAGTLTARHVVDTRPPPASQWSAATLFQSFSGRELRLQQPGFDQHQVELMTDMRCDARGFVFSYVLALSATRALVEVTRFAPQPIGAAELAPDLEALLTARGWTHAEVLRGESAILPMGLPAAASPGTARGVVRAGIGAGALRAASGYGFLRIQAWADTCADAVMQGRPPVGHPAEPTLRRWMDRLCLRVLASHPERTPEFFLTLAAVVPGPAFVRFMSDQAGWADHARIIAALPPGPFLQALRLRPFRTRLPA